MEIADSGGSVTEPSTTDVCWCESPALLASIYGLKTFPASANQSQPLSFAGALHRFAQYADSNVDEEAFSNYSIETVCQAAEAACNPQHVVYYPQYGASVVFLPDLPGRLAILVVGLDNWEFTVHR
eukprot:scaffold39868_cov36-Prasinocladus_malaysianus.AAC.1